MLAKQRIQPEWFFARRYRRDDILFSECNARSFLNNYLRNEADFYAACRHPYSGLTYDGLNLDPANGCITGIRSWSAASKECLDLGICIKALTQDPIIARVVSPSDPARAPIVAVDILSRKIKSYKRFQAEYPGLAGYVTWFEPSESLRPAKNWQTAIPTLDLGEMLWALLLAEAALRNAGNEKLAHDYKCYNDDLQAKAKEAMIEPETGGIRGQIQIEDPTKPTTRFCGSDIITGEHCVHESQMIIFYISLFGGLDAKVKSRIWDRIAMKRVEHKYGTTWQGFWGSAHEEWAYLFIPYRDHPGFRDLFRIREKIRSNNATERGYPGFASSAHSPKSLDYMSAAGVEEISSQRLYHQDTYTPYGAFPLLLEFAGQLCGNVGLAWLHNMLMGPKMQGPMGAGESGDNAGTSAAHVKTLDVSFTNLLALAGGLEKETAALLRQKGVYNEFFDCLTLQYDTTFAQASLRETADFGLPLKPAPSTLTNHESWTEG